MTLTGIHFLLTYQCTYECDHCFVWGSPRQTGTFTLRQIEDVYQQALDLGTVDSVYFEGGEAFLFYPILLQAIKRAKRLGFWTGVVSNAYWATGVEDALHWFSPLVEAGLDRIDLSSDLFHGDEMDTPQARAGIAAAKRLGLAVGSIAIEPPTGYRDPTEAEPGTPVVGGGVMYRGRAAETLIEGLPRRPWDTFTECPYENLTDPDRLHVDPLGNLQLCQGVVMDNLFQKPLREIVETYQPKNHPIVGPLLDGGPAELVKRTNLVPESGYVDACHLCYTARTALRGRFPAQLAPDQVYGVF